MQNITTTVPLVHTGIKRLFDQKSHRAPAKRLVLPVGFKYKQARTFRAVDDPSAFGLFHVIESKVLVGLWLIICEGCIVIGRADSWAKAKGLFLSKHKMNE